MTLGDILEYVFGVLESVFGIWIRVLLFYPIMLLTGVIGLCMAIPVIVAVGWLFKHALLILQAIT